VNVLLVDDQSANLLALEAILQNLGHNLVKPVEPKALESLLAEMSARMLRLEKWTV
jgi:CheY-like chemotaxis protein